MAYAYTEQVPFMVIGVCVGIVGKALLSQLGLETPTALWAAYLAVAGFGVGMEVQVPSIALQMVLRLYSGIFRSPVIELTSNQ